MRPWRQVAGPACIRRRWLSFQARRLRIRYRADKGNEIAHTLNGTAVAGRALIALLENNQQADGTVVVPEVLRSFVGLDALTP